MNLLSLLGVLFAFLMNVFLGVGDLNMVYVGWSGLDRIHQTHLKEITSLYQCDNYVLDSKNEEDPRYSVISVRPDVTKYLNATGSSIRLLVDYTTSGGDNLIIMADKTTVYKSSGSLWTTLEAGFSDNPWESTLYDLPRITRLYLCNGLDKNKKFFSGRSRLYNMQNQDDETTITGTMYFTADSLTATGDATAIASIEVGQYIKSATTADDNKWAEVVSIESTTVTFSTLYPGTTANSTVCVRSNDVVNSRHMIEFEGHQILGYTDVSQEVEIAGTTVTTPEYYLCRGGNLFGSSGQANGAYGVFQSFTATNNSISGIKVKMSPAWAFPATPVGNILVKLKDSLASVNPLAEIVYPMASLPLNTDYVTFDFGAVVVTSGNTYYFTIERDGSNTTSFQIEHGSAYAGGNAGWTRNPAGFDSSWATGLTTIEVTPSYIDNLNTDYADTYLDEGNPDTVYKDATSLYVGNYSGNIRKAEVKSLVAYHGTTTEAHPFSSVKYQMYKTGSNTGEVTASRIIINNYNTDVETGKWNSVWDLAGCSSLEGDYTASWEVSVTAPTFEGYITFEVVNMSRNWDIDTNLNYGIIISAETSATTLEFNSTDNATNKPKWLLTTQTGTSETGHDLYFEVLSETSNSSTIRYSKRFKPENFPTLNTFQVPGTIVGLAKSGGYLIVGTKKPDALHFYNATYDTTAGLGIKDTARIDGKTFGGGSHSIAYLSDGSFIFYSGLGVYLQQGLRSTLVSGKIREEAKELTNYRDPLDYYGGLADLMPQAVIDHIKDTYMLAVPKDLGVNSYIYPYNYANNSWVRWTNLYPTAMLYRSERGTIPTLYMGDTSGQVYRLDKTGSINSGATMKWFFSGRDLSKNKRFDLIEIYGRVDNPLVDCVVTLEVQNTNPISVDEVTTAVSQTIVLSDNTTTDAQVRLLFTDIGLSAREIKLTLTQSSSIGAVSWRAIRYKGSVTNP